MTKERTSTKGLNGILAAIIFWAGIGTSNLFHDKSENPYIPKNIHLEYINNDSLPDLIYQSGEIYLQTKEGNFISYNEVLGQEKVKIDSVYQVKADSLKQVYENKLKKGFK